jgi:hypothetical protein
VSYVDISISEKLTNSIFGAEVSSYDFIVYGNGSWINQKVRGGKVVPDSWGSVEEL